MKYPAQNIWSFRNQSTQNYVYLHLFFAFLIVFKWLCSGKKFWNLISLVLQTIHFSWNTSVNTKRWCISGIILLKCWEKHFIGIVHVKVYYIMFPFLHREITSTCSCSMDHRPWTRWPWTNRPVKKRFDWFWPLTEFYLIKEALVSKVCECLYQLYIIPNSEPLILTV